MTVRRCPNRTYTQRLDAALRKSVEDEVIKAASLLLASGDEVGATLLLEHIEDIIKAKLGHLLRG